jgi:hypothetical protein
VSEHTTPRDPSKAKMPYEAPTILHRGTLEAHASKGNKTLAGGCTPPLGS